MAERATRRGDLAFAAAAEPDTGPARTRDPETTRRRILEAAIVEFSSRGLGGARVDAIAARAGVNKRMLYHYFGDKQRLFLAVMESTYASIRKLESELDLDHLEPAEAMRAFVRFTFRYFLDNQHFIALLNSENLHRARHIRQSSRVRDINNPVIERLRRLITRGRRAGVFRAGVDPLQLYISIAGVSYLYFCNIHTLSVIFDRDLAAAAALKQREAHVVAVIMGYLRP